jgi:hypothetical protein
MVFKFYDKFEITISPRVLIAAISAVGLSFGLDATLL